MAYPVLINAQAHGSDNWVQPSCVFRYGSGDVRYFFGPDNNNHVLGISTDHTLRAWKSTDKGVTWSEMDGGNRKLIKYITSQYRQATCAIYDEILNLFHIGYLAQDSDATVGVLRIAIFNPTTDTWGAISSASNAPQVVNTDTNLATFEAAGQAFFISYRQSDGAYVVHFQGVQQNVNTSSFGPPTTNYQRTYYQVYSSGAWGSATMVSGQSGVFADFYASGCISGTGSRTHLFFSAYPDPLQVVFTQTFYIYHVSVNSSDAQTAIQTAAADAKNDVQYNRRSGPPIFRQGEILFPYQRWDGTYQPGHFQNPLFGVLRGYSADTPTWTSEFANTASMPDLYTNPNRNSLFLAAPLCNASIFAFWSIGDGALYHTTNSGTGWSTTYSTTTVGTDIQAFNGSNVTDYTVGIYYGQDGQPYYYPAYYFEYEGLGGTVQGSVGCCESTVGDKFFKRIVGDRGNPPYTYELCIGAVLPPGLTLDPITGIISGTPTTSGTTTTCILVRDADGNTGVTHITTVIEDRDGPDSPGNTLDLNAYQIKFFRGDAYHFTAQVVDNDGPVDITGGTITLTGKYNLANTDAQAAFQIATNLAGILILDASLGIFSVNFPEAKTFGFPPYDTEVFYDIQYETATGEIYTVTNSVATVLVEMSRDVT